MSIGEGHQRKRTPCGHYEIEGVPTSMIPNNTWNRIWDLWNVWNMANASLEDIPANWADKEWLEKRGRVDFDRIEDQLEAKAADMQAMSDLP